MDPSTSLSDFLVKWGVTLFVIVLFAGLVANRADEIVCGAFPVAPRDSVATRDAENLALRAVLPRDVTSVRVAGNLARLHLASKGWMFFGNGAYARAWQEVYARFHHGNRRCVFVVFTSSNGNVTERVWR